jgi:hypothetical protein
MAKMKKSPKATAAWRPGLFMAGDPGIPTQAAGPDKPAPALSAAAVIRQLEVGCFICKKKLTSSNTPNAGTISREHVFPQWLIEKYELKDSLIDFPDGTSTEYAKILVPCCTVCNGARMSDVEDRISVAIKTGDEYPGFMQLSRSDISLWAAKILYGLLYVRLAPFSFKKKQALPPQLKEKEIEHLWLVMRLLDGFRKRMIISAPEHPLSILRFRLKSAGPVALKFNYRDHFQWPTTLAMRMGSAGLIVTFDDFGFIERWYHGELAAILDNQALHPLQFSEVLARVLDTGGYATYDFSYSVASGPHDTHLWLNPKPRAGHNVDHQRLANVIAHVTGLKDLAKLIEGKPKSLLVDRRSAFLDIPFEEGVLYQM